MSTRPTTIAFLIGGVAGAALTWSASHAHERWRRIRRDLRAAKKGVKTLRTMLRHNLAELVRVAAIVALVGVALAWLVTR